MAGTVAGVRQLVALAAVGDPGFPGRLARIWDDGDAILPVDPRLPPAARDRLLDDLAPAVLVDGEGEAHPRSGGEPVEEGDALVMVTSGSTGEPKGVVLTHQAVAASARATSARLGVDPATDRWLACLPLAHVGGLGVVTRALVTGTALTIHRGFDAGAVEEAARQGGATMISLVVTALRRIDPALFRTVVLGGSRPPDEVAANVVTTYGMTETGSGVVYDGLPLGGVEVKIVHGEVHVRGPMLLRCYRNGVNPTTDGGWLATGDAGSLDDRGRLTVLGRRAEMIITGGENVWPGAVEGVLQTHPSVAEVAVAGRPDPEWGQKVVAWVVPADPGRPPTLTELRVFAADQLPAYAAPKQLILVDALPRTALGKVVRPQLPG